MSRIASLGVTSHKFMDKVTRETVTQYHLSLSYLPGSDEMWETVVHPAMFKNEAAANIFLNKVKSNMHRIDFSNWVFECHRCSPMQPANQQGYYSPVFFD